MTAEAQYAAFKARARQRALRTLVAIAESDVPAFSAVLREAGSEDGGVVSLITALAESSNANAATLAPEDWLDQLRFRTLAESAVTPEEDEPS